MLKAYVYAIYPSDEQKIKLNEALGRARFVYNWGLGRIKEIMDANKERPKDQWIKIPTAFDLSVQLTQFKKTEGYEWLAKDYSRALGITLSNLGKGMSSFFKEGKGFPKFKKRGDQVGICFDKGLKFDLENKTIKFYQGIGPVDAILHRQFEGIVRKITITRRPSGKYFASVLVNTPDIIPEQAEICEETAVGVDWGIKTFATLSDGVEYENIKAFKRLATKLSREQRKLSRKFKKGISARDQSKNYQKQKLAVARVYERISNIRSNRMHEVTTEIVTNYDTVCIEDLNVKGMTASAKGTVDDPGRKVKQKAGLNKAILDCAPGEFRRQLEYKAAWKGKHVLKCERFFASSKTCSCGHKNDELTLADRTWTCSGCGKENDRDLNAAQNIKNQCLQNEGVGALIAA